MLNASIITAYIVYRLQEIRKYFTQVSDRQNIHSFYLHLLPLIQKWVGRCEVNNKGKIG